MDEILDEAQLPLRYTALFADGYAEDVTDQVVMSASPEGRVRIVGNNVTVTPTPGTPGPEHAGLGTIEEGIFDNGRWIPSRQLSGDEAGGGDYVNLRTHPTDRIPADRYVGIQHFTMYRYR